MSNELAVLSKENEGIIQNYAQNTLSTLVQFDNISGVFTSEACKAGAEALSKIAGGLVTQKIQKDYSSNLSFIERMGFINQNKRISYETKIGNVKKGINVASQMITTVAPLIVKKVSDTKNKFNVVNFFMSWMGYINKGNELSKIMLSNARTILTSLGVFNNQNLQELIYKGSAMMQSQLPTINKHNKTAFNNIEIEQMNTIAKLTIAGADLNNPTTRDRATEFLQDMFNMGNSEAANKLNDVIEAQEYLSDLLIFSSVDYVTFFTEFAKSVKDSWDMAKYDINMDPYAMQRNKNKETVINVAKEYGKKALEVGAQIAMSAATQGAVPPMGIVNTSNKMLEETLKPSKDKAWDFMDKIIERNDAYGIEAEEE